VISGNHYIFLSGQILNEFSILTHLKPQPPLDNITKCVLTHFCNDWHLEKRILGTFRDLEAKRDFGYRSLNDHGGLTSAPNDIKIRHTTLLVFKEHILIEKIVSTVNNMASREH
jgi:hypothetical protein